MQQKVDNNFDKTFKLMFENAEIQPQKDLWSAIEKQIEPQKNNRLTYWFASAASIAIISIIGVFLLKSENKIQLRGTEFVTNITDKKNTNLENLILNKNTTSNVSVHTKVFNKKFNASKNEIHISENENTPERKYALINMQAMQQISPLNNIPLEKKIVYSKPDEVFNTNLLATNFETKLSNETVEPSKKISLKNIQSIGGLINYLVDKIDHRENKFIAFKENEDENTAIIALNINFTELNKKD